MRKILYVILIAITFFSCQNTKTKDDTAVLLQATPKIYTFNLDFIRYRTNMGRFTKNDTSLFYFFHPIYSKQIDIYNEQQKKVDSISLSKYTTVNDVVYVDFLNSDTLSLRTRQGIIYLINSSSNLLKTIDINNIQSQLNDTLVEINYPIDYSDTYQAALISTYNGKWNPYGFDQYCDLLRYFMRKTINTKRLVLIDNVFADSLTLHHSIEQLEKPYLGDDYFVNVMYKRFFWEDKLIMYSYFSDKLLLISLENRKVEKQIPIKSKYKSPIFTPRLKIGDKSEECFNAMDKYRYSGNEGLIKSVYYSSYTQRFYVAVRHKQQTDNDDEKRYSILAYDTDFNKIGETDLMFNPLVMWSEKGVYISNSKDVIGDKQVQLKYYEFNK